MKNFIVFVQAPCPALLSPGPFTKLKLFEKNKNADSNLYQTKFPFPLIFGRDGGSFGTFRTHFEPCALSFEPCPMELHIFSIPEFRFNSLQNMTIFDCYSALTPLRILIQLLSCLKLGSCR